MNGSLMLRNDYPGDIVRHGIFRSILRAALFYKDEFPGSGKAASC